MSKPFLGLIKDPQSLNRKAAVAGIAFIGGRISTSDSKNSIPTGVYANEGRIRQVGSPIETFMRFSKTA